MKLLNRLLLAFLAIGIISCSNDEPSIESSSALQSKTGEEPEIETFDIKVSYRGKMYVVPCEYVNDSLYYLNEEFNDLFINEISKSENIITSYNPETEIIEYFTSNEEFKASQKVDLKQLIATGPSTPTEQVFQPRYHEHIIGDPANNDAEAILFDDTDYKDSRLLIICTYSSNPLYTPFKQIENMGLFDMNDKTSSLRVHTVHNHGVNKDAILICFENSNHYCPVKVDK